MKNRIKEFVLGEWDLKIIKNLTLGKSQREVINPYMQSVSD